MECDLLYAQRPKQVTLPKWSRKGGERDFSQEKARLTTFPRANACFGRWAYNKPSILISICAKKVFALRLWLQRVTAVAQTNIIELNGKRYDAATGELLGEGAMAGLKHAELRRQHRGRTMDIMPSVHSATQTEIAQHAVEHHKVVAKAKPHLKADIMAPKKHSARQTKVIAAHQPQKSSILMRTAVKKPTFKMKEAIKTQAPTEMRAAPVATIVPKASAYRVEPRRVARANSVARSQHIRRFAANTSAKHDVNVAAAGPTPRPLARTATRSDISRPTAHHAVTPQQPKQTHTQDIFEAAIAHAASHLEPAPKIKRHHSRWLHAAVIAVVFFGVGGAVMWANKANIEVHFASMRAGFHVVVPSYAPDGYTLTGNVTTNNGKATLDYRSGDAAYTVSEQASTWDSATLQSSTVALQKSPQVMQTAGRTVYLYGNGDAMWVDGGVLYNLVANGSLSNAEIANLTASL